MRSRKSPLRPEMNSKKKSRNAERKYSGQSAEFYPKRNPWIRSWKSSRSGKQATQPKKKNSRKRNQKLRNFMSRACRNWSESQVLPPTRQKNIF